MSWHKVKLDAADKLFSKLVRERDQKCVRCRSSENLQCSHYWSRGCESTRFDFENAETLCAGCHRDWENQKEIKIHGEVILGEYALWKLEQLGQKRYDALKIRAHQFKKKDRKFELIRLKAIKESLK